MKLKIIIIYKKDMTLKEQFKDIVTDAITYKQQEDSFVRITHEFTIEFVKWLIKNQLFYPILYGRIEIKELLEIYRKDQGL